MSTHCQDPWTGDFTIFHFLPPDVPPSVWGLRLKKTLSTSAFSISYVSRSPPPFIELGGGNSWILASFFGPLFPLILLWHPLRQILKETKVCSFQGQDLGTCFLPCPSSQNLELQELMVTAAKVTFDRHIPIKSLFSGMRSSAASLLIVRSVTWVWKFLSIHFRNFQDFFLMPYCVVPPVGITVVKILYKDKGLCTYVCLIHLCYFGVYHKITLIWERLRIALIFLGYLQQHCCFH